LKGKRKREIRKNYNEDVERKIKEKWHETGEVEKAERGSLCWRKGTFILKPNS
jgi:hypothetical protein